MPNRLVSLLLLFLLCVLGCGPSRPTTVPVKGTITFAGGPPPTTGMVFFSPLEPAAGYSAHPGFGAFDQQGKLTVTSFQEGDGLIPGRYQVRIECWKTAPDENGGGVSYVPDSFTSSDVVATVGQPVEVKIDIPRS